MPRPKGSKNADTVQQEASRCPTCHSTRRRPYDSRHVQEFDGIDTEGRPFTAIIRRRTTCLDCGQHRIDREYWYSLTMPDPTEPPAETPVEDDEKE